jgi:hypothetical protein
MVRSAPGWVLPRRKGRCRTGRSPMGCAGRVAYGCKLPRLRRPPRDGPALLVFPRRAPPVTLTSPCRRPPTSADRSHLGSSRGRAPTRRRVAVVERRRDDRGIAARSTGRRGLGLHLVPFASRREMESDGLRPTSRPS